ncbi:MAG TPA: ZIP family metal transporter, partial [Rhodocyclaceae bacterium]
MNATPPASIATALWASKPLPQKALATIVLAGFVLQGLLSAIECVGQFLADSSSGTALWQSLFAGLATAIGAVLLATLQRPSPRGLGIAMAIAAGAMSMAAILTLLIPASQHEAASPTTIALALGVGAALMFLIDRALPHEHPQPDAKRLPATASRRAAWLLVVAITLHNFPEGFAVAAAAAGTGGTVTATAIALQNIPEGLIIAAVLWAIGLRRSVAIGIAAASGLAEPVGALLGIVWLDAIPGAAPSAMALAAGAMLFVVAHELLPTAVRALASWRAG